MNQIDGKIIELGRFLKITVVAGLLSALASGCGLAGSSGSVDSVNGQNSSDLLQRQSITEFGLEGTHTIALTFDDGPTAKVTPLLLQYLRSQGLHASFFLLGENLIGNETTAFRISAEGHTIGNHTQDHQSLTGAEAHRDPTLVIDELLYAHASIFPYLGHQRHMYFRAPYGDWSGVLAGLLNAKPDLRPYIGPIYWTVGGELRQDSHGRVLQSADWDCWAHHLSVDACMQGYLAEMDRFDGGVVLMHDSDPRTLQMVQRLIPIWKSQGYRFVTLEQMHNLDQYE